MRSIVVILALIATTYADCQVGCLRCSTNNVCLLCDVSNGYFQSNNTCITGVVDNCVRVTQDMKCAVCKPNFFADPNTKKCVAVPATNQITGCSLYNQQFACTLCNPGFYFSLGTCVATNQTVSNCKSQTATGACQECQNGYISTYNLTGCIAVPQIPNCMTFQHVTCSKCKSNFFLNTNLYNVMYSNQEFYEYFAFWRSLLPSEGNAGVCQPITVSNCATILNATACSVCNAGYHLVNSTCEADLPPAIFNCEVYSRVNTCTRCANMYNLVNNACVAVTPVIGCVAYDGSSSVTTCSRCNDTAYLSANNVCTNRTVLSIPNCAKLSDTDQTCDTCNAGFIHRQDFLLCLPIYGYCDRYDTASTLANPICLSCQLGYFPLAFNGTHTCQANADPNCLVVDYANPTTCIVCKQGFYVTQSISVCTAQPVIPNCAQYPTSTPYHCSTCAVGTFRVSIFNTCDPADYPANCNSWSSSNGCTGCIDGYYLSGGNCLAIPVPLGNCLAASSTTTCTKCAAGIVLLTESSVTSCQATPDYLSNKCTSLSESVQNWNFKSKPSGYPTKRRNYCNSCAAGAVSYLGNYIESICVKTSELKFYSNYAVVFGCQRYGLSIVSGSNDPRIVCMECVSGSFISGYWNNIGLATATTCVSSCSLGGANLILFDDMLGFRNICVPVGTSTGMINLPACAYMARTSLQAQGVWATSVASGGSGDWVCVTPSSGNFMKYATQTFNPIAATSTSTEVTQTVIDFIPYAIRETGPSPSFFNFRGPVVSAILSTAVTLGSQQLTDLADCDYLMTVNQGSAFATGTGYTQATAAFDGCMRCKFGFQLFYTVTGASGNANFPKCQTMAAACSDSTIVRGGLMSHVAALISCHSCAPSGATVLYPTVWVEQNAFTASANPGFIIQYALPTITAGVADANHGFRCAQAPTTITTANTAPTAGAQVANCAIFGVFTAITTASTASNTKNSYCLACRSGFYPLYFGAVGGTISVTPNFVPTYAVTQCVASVNCDNTNLSQPYNSCGKCSTASDTASPAIYYAYSDLRLINCLAVSARNCFLISSSGTSVTAATSDCLVCQAGYFLNGDKYCEKFTVPNQAANSYFAQSYYSSMLSYGNTSPSVANDPIYTRTFYLLSAGKSLYGASGCADGYTRAPPSHYAPILCAQSEYISRSPLTLPNPSIYPANCLAFSAEFSNNFQVRCSMCATGYILKDDNSGCAATLNNCLAVLASDVTKCSKCASGYFNINNACVNTLITNCQAYASSATTSTSAVTCSACQSGYFLNSAGNVCALGSVPNCSSYQQGSGTICTGCLPNFVRIAFSDGIYFCLALNGLYPNCKIHDTSTFFQEYTLKCSDCYNTASQKYLLRSMPSPRDRPGYACIPHPQTNNCTAYDLSALSLTVSTGKCIACQAGFYFDSTNKVCIKRQVTPVKCSSYSATMDQCTGCQQGYYLTNANNDCLPNPTGVPNCLKYTNLTVCAACQAPYYLATNNTCLLSPTIDGCAVYSSNFTCTACTAGKYLFNATSCQTATATNCLTYTSGSVCASCPAGFGLQTTNSVTSCVSNAVANCDISTTTAPFTCLNCTNGFYLNNGTCTAVTTTISNCVAYDSNSTCSQCASGYLLMQNKTLCNNTLFDYWSDPNCASPQLLSTPVCSICSPGYSFVNGVCTACSVNNVDSGCAACDPLNNTNCLWCVPGKFYMNNNTKCVKIPDPPANTTTNTTPTPYVPAGDSKLLTAVTLVLIWLFGFQN